MRIYSLCARRLGAESLIAVPENAPKVNYRPPGFLSKFLELQQVMWTTNQGLTDRHAFDSRPEHWPWMRRGIVSAIRSISRFGHSWSVSLQNFWVKDHRQIYLIGNPVIWYLSTIGVFAYVAVRGFLLLRAKRGYHDFENSQSLLL